MFTRAALVRKQVDSLMASSHEYIGYTPLADQLGPLVATPYVTDGHVGWRGCYALVLGPVSLCVNHYRQVRLVRTSRAAQFLNEV